MIRFSGVLKDLAGRAKTGTVGVTFAIYAEPESGAPLRMETQNVTLEEGGKYTVLVGANSIEGVPMELFTNQWQVARTILSARRWLWSRNAARGGRIRGSTMFTAPSRKY
jgi:hypothetical protein